MDLNAKKTRTRRKTPRRNTHTQTNTHAETPPRPLTGGRYGRKGGPRQRHGRPVCAQGHGRQQIPHLRGLPSPRRNVSQAELPPEVVTPALEAPVVEDSAGALPTRGDAPRREAGAQVHERQGVAHGSRRVPPLDRFWISHAWFHVRRRRERERDSETDSQTDSLATFYLGVHPYTTPMCPPARAKNVESMLRPAKERRAWPKKRRDINSQN